jgi:hypothetical protein
MVPGACCAGLPVARLQPQAAFQSPGFWAEGETCHFLSRNQIIRPLASVSLPHAPDIFDFPHADDRPADPGAVDGLSVAPLLLIPHRLLFRTFFIHLFFPVVSPFMSHFHPNIRFVMVRPHRKLVVVPGNVSFIDQRIWKYKFGC